MYRSDRWLEAKLKAIFGETQTEALGHWIRAAREQPPVLFVGAGLSLNAKAKESSPGKQMMSWWALTEGLKKDLGDRSDGNDYLWIAERFKCLFGLYALHAKIREAVPDGHVDPGPEHFALRRVNWHSVLTLNYDTLLERALQGGGARTVIPVISQEQAVRLTARSSLPVIHLHGHIEHASTIVLTLEDFRAYPESHAIFLTIARQLLLQHPVLFLGFGANDPNFVAWSGWIRDQVGEQAPPWVRLQPDFGSPLDAGMEAYWSPRLKTVPYKLEKFVPLLELLGQAVEPLDVGSDDFLEYIDELVELTRVQKSDQKFFLAVVDEVEKALQEKYPRPLNFVARRHRVGRVIDLLHAGLARAGLSSERVERLTQQSREHTERWLEAGATRGEWLKVPPEALPTIDEQKREIREAMRENFLPWLISAVRLAGRLVPLSEQGETRFDAVEEYGLASLAQGQNDSRTLRQLGMLTLPHELERLGAAPDEAAAVRWLRVTSRLDLSEEERRMLDDLLWRHRLLWGRLPSAGLEGELKGAQRARVAGYLAAMDGRFLDAVNSYERASTMSAAEQEGLAVQYMTAKSAHILLLSSAFTHQSEIRERRATSDRRLKALRSATRETQFDVTIAERDHARDRLKRLSEEGDGVRVGEPDRTIFRSRSESLEPVLDYYEEYWFSPTLIAPTAESVGSAQWSGDEKVAAAALLARYGSDELALRARVDTESPRSTALPGDLLDELQREPRWAHERYARLRALTEVVSELPSSKRAWLLEYALESFAALRDHPLLLTHRSSFPGAPAVMLGVAAGRHMRWTEFKPWLTHLDEASGDYISQLGEADWLELPVRWWLRNDGFQGREADGFFAFLLKLAHEVSWRVSQGQVLNLLSNLVLEEGLRVPADGAAVRALRDWLGDAAPQDDGDEWLRTECVVALGVLEGRVAREVHVERAALLKALIDSIVGAKWPDPYTVRAWLACVEDMTPSDVVLGRRLQSMPFPAADDAVESARTELERRMHARVMLLLWARLGMESAVDAARAHEFLAVTARRMPAALSELAVVPLARVDSGLRAAYVSLVSDAFSSTGEHRKRTEVHHTAVSCLAVACASSSLADVPLSWLYGVAGLTAATYPRLASYACVVVRNCLMRWANEWTEAHASVLDELRRGLLRATADGRAYVVAAGRRALLDVGTAASPLVRERVVEHEATRRRLEELENDTRLAVVVAAEAWTRDAP